MSALQQAAQEEFDKEHSSLQCLEVDLASPLSTLDWRNFTNIIKETKALGWVQILPTYQKSSHPFQFNTMHILPNSNIPVPKLPIDVLIKNKQSYMKKKAKAE